MKNKGSFGVHFGPGVQAGGAVPLGQVPAMSLEKLVSEKHWVGQKSQNHSTLTRRGSSEQ